MPFDGTSHKTTAFEQLAKAQESLDSGRRWVQYEWAVGDGRCALAALCQAVYGEFGNIPPESEQRSEPAFRAVEAALRRRGFTARSARSVGIALPIWNDWEGRTWEEVNAFFEDAKEFALASE